MNTLEMIKNIDRLIAELEEYNNKAKQGWVAFGDYDSDRMERVGWIDGKQRFSFKISAIFEECDIFDWWNNTLSVSQLKQMRAFLVTAHKLGFDGYCCFRVGAKYCSHGMWAHKNESTDGYSPDGDVLFHSFRNGDNYWDMCLDGQWMHDKYPREDRGVEFTLAQIKNELRGAKKTNDVLRPKKVYAE